MITVFSVPKAFSGKTALAQENAVRSWRALGAEVFLFGDDDGVEDAAGRLGARHFPDLQRNQLGTPLLHDAFASARRESSAPILCFVNADIVLLDDVAPAFERVHREGRTFLAVGESWDVAITEPLVLVAGWQDRLRALTGRKRGAGALDYFAFSRELYPEIPPFAIGRVGFDNWLVWKARDQGALVADLTAVVHAIHQRHDYGHVRGGFDETRRGAEAAENWALIGDKSRLYTRFDATHLLTPRGLRRNLGATLRAKERARKALWKLRHGQLSPARTP